MADGIIRPVDRMGRVVIPKEIRKQLNIESDVDSVQITVEGDKVIIKKYQPTCMFCSRLGPSIEFQGNVVCKECIEKLELAKEHIK